MAWQEGGMKARLDLRLGQKLVMTPQLQQAIKLLQLSRLELNQVVEQEMIENPLLEEVADETSEGEGEPAESSPEEADRAKEEGGEATEEERENLDLKWDSFYEAEERERVETETTVEMPDERPSYEQTLARPVSLADHLLWQLGLVSLTEREREIGTVLIGNIEDNGYLETPLEEIAGSLCVPAAEVEAVLKVIQGFDPAGVGARNLTECLLIQIGPLGLSGSLVETLIKHHLENLEKRRYANIVKECGVSMEEVLQASKIIEHLEPKPGRPFYSNENFSIIPDVFIVKTDEIIETQNEAGTTEAESPSPTRMGEAPPPAGGPEKYICLLNDDGLPKMKISGYYQSLLKSKKPEEAATRTYLEEKFRSAVWLIRSIEQRNRTILKVAESILKFQYAFMEKGVSHLKPLVLKQVAEDISMHESTVSRVTTHKYIHTPQGIYELKFFFNGSLASVGGGADPLSSVAVREKIERMVSEENAAHPLTDQEIVDRLKRDNVEIARRTVSKYRAELKIATASRRRRPA